MQEKQDLTNDHEFCLRCGRKLKNPIARQKGYGIVCEKKMKISESRRLFETGQLVAQGFTVGLENDDNLQSSQ